jgi:hypothetical protein
MLVTVAGCKNNKYSNCRLHPQHGKGTAMLCPYKRAAHCSQLQIAIVECLLLFV